MSVDEIMRVMAYTVLVPGTAYLGVRIWNAWVMPEELRKPIAMFLWVQASIYTLFMIGLLLTRLWHPIPFLLYINTVLIGTQAIMIVLVGFRVSRIKRYVPLLVATVLTLLMMMV